MRLSNFLERLGLKKNPNGETVQVEDGLRNVGNGYFREIGQYFKTAQILLFVILFLFVTVFALTNSDSITYENLYYFVKDFRTAVDNTDASADAISYETDTNTTFKVYKGGLAVAGTERLRLLTAAGGLNISATLGFAEPGMSASTDLLLVYGRGENECHIYNSFTKIHAESFEGCIRTAYLSESGAYSVTTEDKEYESAVYVYSRNFRKLNKYNLNSSVIAAPLSADGKSIAILSYVCTDGVYETRVRLAEVGSDKVYHDYSIAGDFPLGIAFTENGQVLVLTDGGLFRVTKKNGGSCCAEWLEGSVTAFDMNESGAVIFLEGSEAELYGTVAVFNGDGETVRYIESETAVHTVRKYEEYVFYRTDGEIVRADTETGVLMPLPCTETDGELLAVSVNTAVLCLNGEARYYRFGK